MGVDGGWNKGNDSAGTGDGLQDVVGRITTGSMMMTCRGMKIGPRDGDGQVDERLWPSAADKGQTATKHQLERCRARLDQLPA